jgi:hypothetical protein
MRFQPASLGKRLLSVIGGISVVPVAGSVLSRLDINFRRFCMSPNVLIRRLCQHTASVRIRTQAIGSMNGRSCWRGIGGRSFSHVKCGVRYTTHSPIPLALRTRPIHRANRKREPVAHDWTGDPESILTTELGEGSGATLRLILPFALPSPVETAVLQYAESLERLIGTDAAAPDDPYTRGFVAGLRAAAKVAANVAGA